MRKHIFLWMLVFVAAMLTGCSRQSVVPGLIDWASGDHTRAEQMVHALVQGEYATVRDNFNGAMNSEFSLRNLQNIWESMMEEAGDFIDIETIEQLPHEEFDIYLVTSKHEHKNIVTRVVFPIMEESGTAEAAETGEDDEEAEEVKESEIKYPLVTGLHFRFDR